MLKEISTFILNRINAVNPYWTLDINYFVGHKPVRNKNGLTLEQLDRIAVILENSPADLIGDLPDRQDKPIQILNRHSNFFTAREDAYQFFNDLHGENECDLPVLSSGLSYTVMIIDGIGSPVPIENPDEKARFVFSTNYLFRICEK